MSDSTRTASARHQSQVPGKRGRPKAGTPRKHFRPDPPFPKFPLTAISTGLWAKRVRGKLYYFGRWAKRVKGELVALPDNGWQDALALYTAQKADLESGNSASKKREALTISVLCNCYLTHQEGQLVDKQIKERTLAVYIKVVEYLCNFFGPQKVVEEVTPLDFQRLRTALSKHYGPTRVRTTARWIKGIFNYGFENDLLERPVKTGSAFKLTAERQNREVELVNEVPRIFSREEIHELLKTATVPMAAAIMLGINCGFGNKDVGTLIIRAVDLKKGWVDYARPKTGVARRCPLWPETVAAIKLTIEQRPIPKAGAEKILLLTPRGNPMVHERHVYRTQDNGSKTYVKTVSTDVVCIQFSKLLKDLGINGRRALGFYSLRATFATQGLEERDRDAVKALMGHKFSDALAAYDRLGPSDERLTAVTSRVRQWLYNLKGGDK
jgi:integrase